MPKHSTHPDVVAAREALEPSEPARLTDTSRYADEVDIIVREYMLDPRGSGRLAAY